MGNDAGGDARGDSIALSAGGTAAGTAAIEEHPAWPMISRLPTVLSVSIPLSGFKVRDLLALQSGQIIKSSWGVAEGVPLKVGALQLSWGDFEVVDERMALRLTRLA